MNRSQTLVGNRIHRQHLRSSRAGDGWCREQGCDIAAIVSKGHAADPAFKLEKPRVSRLLELYCETAPERVMRIKPDREELRVMAGK